MQTAPVASAARSAGQSQNGGSDVVAGAPMRSAATFVRSRRCTTALVKCVVPISTALTSAPFAVWARSMRYRRQDAAGDVGRRRRLDGSLDPAVRDQNGVRVGAADVDADAFHDANAEWKSMSYPNARGPTWSRPRGVRKISGDGSTMTVTRWP